jgi:hypothetical protein
LVYGSSYVTYDLDVPEDLVGIKNLYLETDVGVLNLISDVIGVREFSELSKNAIEIKIFGKSYKVISLNDLIKTKNTLKRPKDILVVQETESLARDRMP